MSIDRVNEQVSAQTKGKDKEIKIKNNKEYDPKLLNAFDKNGDGYLRGEEIEQFQSIWGEGKKNISSNEAQAQVFLNTGLSIEEAKAMGLDVTGINNAYTVGGEKVGEKVLDNAEINAMIAKVAQFRNIKPDPNEVVEGKSIKNILTGVEEKVREEHEIALNVFDTNSDGNLSKDEIEAYNKWADKKTSSFEKHDLLVAAAAKKESALGIKLGFVGADGKINFDEKKIGELSKQYGVSVEVIKEAAGDDGLLSLKEIGTLVDKITKQLDDAKHKDAMGGFGVVKTKGLVTKA